MANKEILAFTFIIRASGEATVEALYSQLLAQILNVDTLLILDDANGFENKLKSGYELAIKIDNPYSVFIDGDILLRSNAVCAIRKIAKCMVSTDFGFGLRLWDQFYAKPKFRGLHIYNTKLLETALKYIPKSGEQLRPESYVKSKIATIGYCWRNDLTFYVAGIHDYFQKPSDIYYKFLVRSKRSPHDICMLKARFKAKRSNSDYKIALQGLMDGEAMTVVKNNKYLYDNFDTQSTHLLSQRKPSSLYVDGLVLWKLFFFYRLNSMFWKSVSSNL